MRRFVILVIVLIGVVVTGCEGVTVDIPVTVHVPPTASGSTIQHPTMPKNLPSAQVVKVVDGDTLDVRLNGQTLRLRLIGINTPESVDPRQPVECFGREASDRAKALLTGQTVFLESDPSQTDRDRYDRLLRYVWFRNGQLFNLVMIAEGFAYEYTYDVPYKYQPLFRRAQLDTQQRQIGLWSPKTCNGRTN
jgi:micrococcal nuclease